MSSMATADTDSMLSDFSSSLLNATGDGKAGERKTSDRQANDRKANQANISGNCNLSSVLSQIQDNGPAGDEVTKRGGARGTKTEHANAYAYDSNVSNLNANNADANNTGANNTEAEYSVKQKAPDVGNNNSDAVTGEDALYLSSYELRNAKQLRFITRPLFLFIALFFVIVAVAMYKLDLHVKNSINQTLLNINTNYSSLNHKHEDSLGSRLLTKSNEVASITTNVSSLTFEIRSLRKELESVKYNIAEANDNKLKITSNTKASDKKEEAVSKASVKLISANKSTNKASKTSKTVAEVGSVDKPSLVNTRLIVNLASLSNEEQANKLVKKLYAAGLSPLIEKAVVKKKQVYRISVSGFKDYDEAALFVKDSGKKYGLPGSWIRKS